MVRSVPTIEREIAAIQSALETLADEFYEAYDSYLVAFAANLRQQIILAAYQVCTQGYPHQFLRLSLQQRQTLQQKVRSLCHEAETTIKTFLKHPKATAFAPELPHQAKGRDPRLSLEELITLLKSGQLPNVQIVTDIASRDPASNPAEPIEPFDDDFDSDPDAASEQADGGDYSQAFDVQPLIQDASEGRSPSIFTGNSTPLSEQPDLGVLDSLAANPVLDDLQTSQSLPVSVAEEVPTIPDLLTPHHLARWHHLIEDTLQENLQDLSQKMNQQFKATHIFPKSLPDTILEMASKSEAMFESEIGMPNLVKLQIEAEQGDEDGSEVESIQLLVIHIRLADLEFSNPILAPKRKQIRDLRSRLNQLGQEYQRVHEEKAIAEAEAAWRSSWYED